MAEIAPTSFSLMKPSPWMIDSFTVLLSEARKITGVTVGAGKSPSLSRINGLFEKIQTTLSDGFPAYLPFFIEMMEAGNIAAKAYLLVYRQKDALISDSVTYRLDACYSYQKRNYSMGTQYCADHTFDLVFYVQGKETRRLPLNSINRATTLGQPSKKLVSLKAKEKPVPPPPPPPVIQPIAPEPVVNKPIPPVKAIPVPTRKVHRLTAKAVEKPKEPEVQVQPVETIGGKVFNEVTRKIGLLDLAALNEVNRQIEGMVLVMESLAAIKRVADAVTAVDVSEDSDEGQGSSGEKKRSRLLQYAKKLFRKK